MEKTSSIQIFQALAPPKFNEVIPKNDAIFEAGYTFSKPAFFGIHADFSGVQKKTSWFFFPQKMSQEKNPLTFHDTGCLMTGSLQ